MDITISGGNYEEMNAIASLIRWELRERGIEVNVGKEIKEDPAQNIIIHKMVGEGFPINLEIT